MLIYVTNIKNEKLVYYKFCSTNVLVNYDRSLFLNISSSDLSYEKKKKKIREVCVSQYFLQLKYIFNRFIVCQRELWFLES